MLVLDCETYRDYFLLSMLNPETGKVRHFELFDGHPFDAQKVKGFMAKHTTVGFNSLDFDLPMIVLACGGWSPEQIKGMADKIISSKGPSWRVLRDAEINIPRRWDHIDLINVAPGQASLKIYGGRLDAPKMQDLPIPPDASIALEQRDTIRRYCVNDLETTARLYAALAKPIDLRASMSEQYGMDLRSKSDAQIAETVIKSELRQATGKDYRAPTLPKDYGFHYRDPGIIDFRSPELCDMFERLRAHRFTLSDAGQVQMPDWLRKEPVMVAGRKYQMGIGGLHSMEKRQHIEADDDHCLADWDVASYYPSIILQQQLAPQSLGPAFLSVYESIVNRRIRAKRTGDKATADTLKIAINGSFGKLGSKYSFLYSPDLLIQTTITGQLALLMLIERMSEVGIDVVSANTDGIVLHHHRDMEPEAERVAWDWQLDTSYTLERTDYQAVASRDVNNYVAVKTDGGTKGKGCFASGGLMKNPDQRIVSEAVARYIANGAPLEQTIRECDDVTQFVTVRTVKGGAVWRGEPLGKAIRFYVSTDAPQGEAIHYATNGNRVPRSNGCRPLMDLPDAFPPDVDHAAYIEAAQKLLAEVGAA